MIENTNNPDKIKEEDLDNASLADPTALIKLKEETFASSAGFDSLKFTNNNNGDAEVALNDDGILQSSTPNTENTSASATPNSFDRGAAAAAAAGAYGKRYGGRTGFTSYQNAQRMVFDGKRMRKAIQRRTVDFNCSIGKYLQDRVWMRDRRDIKILRPDTNFIIDLLPPSAYLHNPVNAVTTKFVHTSTNKNRYPVFVVRWTPEGRRLITGLSSGEFTLWNGLTFNFETILQAHESAVRAMKWSHNDDWMVTADHKGIIKYWQSNMNNLKIINGHKEAIRDLSFAPTDNKFATCSDDGTIKIWDFNEGIEENVLSGHGGDVKAVDWHPYKALLASGAKDNLVKFWDPKSGKNIDTLHGHKNTIVGLQWNKNGNWLGTAARDQLIKVYDIRMMKDLQTFRGHKKEVCSISWHPFHEQLLATGGSEGSLMFWIVGQDAGPVDSVEYAHENNVWSLDWHPLGHILVSGSNDHTTRFWTRPRPGDTVQDKFHVGKQKAEELGLKDVDVEEEDDFVPGLTFINAPGMNTYSPPIAPGQPSTSTSLYGPSLSSLPLPLAPQRHPDSFPHPANASQQQQPNKQQSMDIDIMSSFSNNDLPGLGGQSMPPPGVQIPPQQQQPQQQGHYQQYPLPSQQPPPQQTYQDQSRGMYQRPPPQAIPGYQQQPPQQQPPYQQPLPQHQPAQWMQQAQQIPQQQLQPPPLQSQQQMGIGMAVGGYQQGPPPLQQQRWNPVPSGYNQPNPDGGTNVVPSDRLPSSTIKSKAPPPLSQVASRPGWENKDMSNSEIITLPSPAFSKHSKNTYSVTSSSSSKSRSPLSNVMEYIDDDSASISSMASYTPPSSVTTSISSSLHNEFISSRKIYYGGGATQNGRSPPPQQQQHHTPLPQSPTSPTSPHSPTSLQSPTLPQPSPPLSQLNQDPATEFSDIEKNGNDGINKPIFPDNNPINSESLKKLPTNKILDTRIRKRQSGLLESPTKDRPFPPKSRKPSITQLPGDSWETKQKYEQQLQQREEQHIPLPIKLPETLESQITETILSPPLPLSPLDKLSQGLIKFSQQHSGSRQQSLMVRSVTPVSAKFTNPMYSAIDVLQNSMLSMNSIDNTILNGGGSLITNSDNYAVYNPTVYTERTDQQKPLSHRALSTNSEQMEPSRLIDRSSTGSSIGKSLQRIKQVTNSTTSNTKKLQTINSSNEEDEHYEERETELPKMQIVDSLGSDANGITTSSLHPVKKEPVKRSSRGNKKPPPTKPQPPKQSLTETLIASGQADIAHQVLVTRRVQTSLLSDPIPIPPPIPQFNKQPLRKPKKHIALKDISTPHLVSSSSNVKSVPIVHLSREDDLQNDVPNGNVRRKFSLRDSESSLGKKFSKKLKDVFSGDNEVTKNGKKQKRNFESSSPNSSSENLPRKFTSEENLRKRYMAPSKNNGEINSRKTFHDIHQNGRKGNVNNLAYLVNTNNCTTLLTDIQPEMSETNRVAHSDINNHEAPFQALYNNRWVVSDSELVKDPSRNKNKLPKKSESSDKLAPLYDIDGIKRHAEMVTKYSSAKKAGTEARASSQSENSQDSSSNNSTADKKSSLNRDNWPEQTYDENTILTSPPQKLSVQIPLSGFGTPQPQPILYNDQPHNFAISSRDTFGSDSLPSPLSTYSPTSIVSDATSGRISPPPIAPRNPLRGNFQQQWNQPPESRSRRNDSMKSNHSDNNTLDGGDKRGSRGSRTSSRLLSIFHHRTNNGSGKGFKNKRTSNNSSTDKHNSGDISEKNNNGLDLIQANFTDENKNTKKPKNKIVRRTIIITKSSLPPLPDESEESEATVSIKLAHRASRQVSLRKKKIGLDGGIHVSSHGKKWYLTKEEQNSEKLQPIKSDVKEDNNETENDNSNTKDGISGDITSDITSDIDSTANNSDRKSITSNNTSNRTSMSSTNLLAVPIKRKSINRPPTPLPSPGSRQSGLELPYGIPIPPIPDKHDSYLSLNTPLSVKRSSKTSMTSTLSSGSRKRKSLGGKSIYSTYGDSLYDYYDYSDQEDADNEGKDVQNKDQKQEEKSEIGEEYHKREIISDDESINPEEGLFVPINVNEKELVEKLEKEEHVELLELDDGSLIWQVVNGLRGDDMINRYSYFYNAGDEEEYNDSQMWAREFGESDDEEMMESELRTLDSKLNSFDYSQGGYLSPLHVSDVQPSSIHNRDSNRSPNRDLHEQWTQSNGSTFSYEDGTNIIPRTSVYIAKDVPLPRLLEEMTRGLGSVDLSWGTGGYRYGSAVPEEERELEYVSDDDDNVIGDAVGGFGMTVEEKLEQVMRALGVVDRDAFSIE
ncbi:5503_t:CDS:10 [Ambispora leptoticha]|uniref:Polyadenylation factor subunit 2 n=1 Tax=Ambispora leptoticha TaxID=144679 RepID=A0A9N8YZS3_9GLOM|nr:5503_t:CDS:10 [Ambispora leptoticha]